MKFIVNSSHYSMNNIIDNLKVDSIHNTISARDLYDYIYIDSDICNRERFSKWFDRQKYGYVKDIDYTYVKEISRSRFEGSRIVTRKMFDYNVSIEMAVNIITNQKRTHTIHPVLQNFFNKYSNFDCKINFNTVKRKEIQFLDELEEVLQPLKIYGIRQYHIDNYRIDYYISSLKLAIEYDEGDHKYYTYENQELRQKNIENILKCTFIRLSDSNSNLYNIGLIMSQILKMRTAA